MFLKVCVGSPIESRGLLIEVDTDGTGYLLTEDVSRKENKSSKTADNESAKMDFE